MQKYKLGQKVWAFKQQGDDFVKTSGVIQMAEINKSGYIQYEISACNILPTGEVKEFKILANHASMAETEPEIDEKIKKYHEWAEAQKEDYNNTFGAPEFNPQDIARDIAELAKTRG